MGVVVPVCRSCGTALEIVLDLGEQPPAGSFPLPADLATGEPVYPLRLAVCPACWLTQLADDGPDEPELLDGPVWTETATMSAHVRRLVRELVDGGRAGPGRRILDTGSHGGHLWPFMREAGSSPVVLERSPARRKSLAQAGASVLDVSLDASGWAALAEVGPFDLIVDLYLLAHLREPDAALAVVRDALAPDGAAVLEFDHILPTLTGRQFDAVRHGHFSYLSLTWLAKAAADHGLTVADARPQPVYGGALRVTLRRAGSAGPIASAVSSLLSDERDAGLAEIRTYRAFADDVDQLRRSVARSLRERRAGGRRLLAYGAPARGNTLLNSCGISTDLIEHTVDRSPAKQGRLLPGSHLPILPPASLLDGQPADVLILAWDHADEIRAAWADVERRGGCFLVPIPALVVLGGDRPPPARPSATG